MESPIPDDIIKVSLLTIRITRVCIKPDKLDEFIIRSSGY